jgi:hypothetical protein
VSLYSTAQTIFAALQDDESAMAAIRAERASLALSLLTDPNGSIQVTSGLMNGAQFAGTHGMKAVDRLTLLGIVCKMDDAGHVLPSQTIPEF